jgi:hypothetical protein
VSALFAQGHTLGFVQLVELLKEERSLGHEGTLAKKRSLRLEPKLGGKGIDIGEKLLFGNVDEGVADPARSA